MLAQTSGTNPLTNNLLSSSPARPLSELGFGETLPGCPKQKSLRQRIHAIAGFILLGVALITAKLMLGTIITVPIALLACSSIAIPIGMISSAGLGLTAFVAFAIFCARNAMRPLPNIAALGLDAASHGAPKLGRYSANNSVVLTENAVESALWKLDLLRSAKQSIELSGNFCGGKIFRKALRAISKNMRSNPSLKVHLIASYDLLESKDYKIIARMQRRFPNFHFLETNTRVTIDPVLRTIENHVKLLVVDEKYYVVGGTGLQQGHFSAGDVPPVPNLEAPWKERFVGGGLRDMDAICQGPLAKTLRLEFFKLWAVWQQHMNHKDPTSGYFPINPSQPTAISPRWTQAESRGDIVHGVKIKALVSDSHKPNAITAEQVRIIKTAKKVVRVASLVFNPPEEISKALQAATHIPGMEVSVITNGVFPFSPPSHRFFAKASYPHYLPLMMGRKVNGESLVNLQREFEPRKIRKAVRIYQYGVPNIQYHKKVTRGDHRFIIGSYNMSKKSNNNDNELVLSISSQALAQRMDAILQRDIQLSRPLTLNEAYSHHSSWIGKFQAGPFANLQV